MHFLTYITLLSTLLFSASPNTMGMQELIKLTASNGEPDNFFGYSTAIDGTTLVVGAYGYNANTGRVYLYEYNTLSDSYEEVAQLRASDGAASDNFGKSVAISGDMVVVGAYYDDDLGTSSGSAYIYKKPVSGWVDAIQDAKLTASDGTASDFFGYSVAISGDTVVVGASHDDDSGIDSGSAYIYERDVGTGLFDQSAKLTASDGNAQDYFGRGVAINGDTVVVGAFANDDSGAAYLYEKPVTGWVDTNQSAKLTASDGASGDAFGLSVAISGETVVVGTHSDDDSGLSSGSVYLYEKPANGWVDTNQSAKLTASDGAAYDYFGRGVAISGDVVVVGAYGDDDLGVSSGSAYLYEKPANGWADANQDAKLKASDGTANDWFGTSVAISGDTVIAGADQDDNDELGDQSGSAYVFKAKPSGVNPAIIMYLLN